MKLSSVQPSQLSWDTDNAPLTPQMIVAHSQTVPEASQRRNSFVKSIKIAQGSLCRSRIHSSEGCLTCMRGLAVHKNLLLDMELNYLSLCNTVHGQSNPRKYCRYISFSHWNQWIDISQHFQSQIKNSHNEKPNSTWLQLWITSLKSFQKGPLFLSKIIFLTKTILKLASDPLVCLFPCYQYRSHHFSQVSQQPAQSAETQVPL